MSKKVKKLEDEIFSYESFPKEYLTSPIVDAFRPELKRLYENKRTSKNLNDQNLNLYTQKLIRLYFYQGLDQPDRLLLHSEFLEFKNKQYGAVASCLTGFLVTYMLTGTTLKYSKFLSLRAISSISAGYFAFQTYKAYGVEKLEKRTEHLYEKYAIK